MSDLSLWQRQRLLRTPSEAITIQPPENPARKINTINPVPTDALYGGPGAFLIAANSKRELCYIRLK